MVIFVFVPVAWLALVLLSLTMFRLGALSDRLHASALAEWMTNRPLEQETFPVEERADQLRYRTRGAAG